ncbi:MAG: recombinase family protein [Cetobacterium sp.]
MRKYLYARVSTTEQSLARQLELAKKYSIRESDIFQDKATGKDFNREEYKKLKLECQSGDIIVIASLDRFGRNKKLCVEEMKYLNDKGVSLVIENIPTTHQMVDGIPNSTTAMINGIIIEIMLSMAEMELENIRSRQKQGYEALKVDEKGRMISKKDTVVGRPNKQENLTKEQERFIRAWISKSIKLSDCIEATRLSRATLYRIKESLD